MKPYRKPHRIKKKKLFIFQKKFWKMIFGLFILGGVFYLLFFFEFFQVKEIMVSDGFWQY